ncbi:recombinase family protein [Lamprobacter modestohalophilus]|uniref:recombinase family protein n=1 Tax=Lamprobacter modestohalophilus TaxID=1064514 RepID=UPI002ADEC6EB|nr:recombinase family protein [Lamprobacter modestohalophilus]MEA1051744.1 recombinase family protein [Lamprobacter modestohalophilus]
MFLNPFHGAEDGTLRFSAPQGSAFALVDQQHPSSSGRADPFLEQVVSRLDRLARSTRDILDIDERLRESDAGQRSLQEPWADKISPAGRLAAQARGVRFGRPVKLSSDQLALAQQRIGEGQTVPEVSNMLKVHRSTLYRAIAPADTISD